jgi:hypothetical protein
MASVAGLAPPDQHAGLQLTSAAADVLDIRAGGQGSVGAARFNGKLVAVKTIPKRRRTVIAAEIMTVSIEIDFMLLFRV